MSDPQPMSTHGHLVAALATAAALFLMFMPCQAQTLPNFKITAFTLKDGAATLQWQGADTNIIVQFTADVAKPLWQPLPGVQWPMVGTSWSGVIPTSLGTGFLRVVTTGGVGTAPIPLKTISLNLIGWHDAQSAQYMQDCVSCHGTRTQEVAMDGVTPTAHSTMLKKFGQGNDRCLSCHSAGVNFLTYSAGALREQVNYEDAKCTACHAGDFYDR